MKRSDLYVRNSSSREVAMEAMFGDGTDTFEDVTICVANTSDESQALDRVISFLRRVAREMATDDIDEHE